MLEADSPPASGPSNAASASSKSPLEMPLRYRIGIIEALRAPGVGRQDRGCEPDAALAGPGAVANPRRAHGNRAKAGHDLALGPMAMAHQPLAAILGVLVGMAAEEGCDLRLDGLRKQGSRAL